MATFKYKDPIVEAVVYFKHPSRRQGWFRKAIYKVDEQEYARLQRAFSDFAQGIDDREFHVLQLANNRKAMLRLNEVCGVLHNSREFVLS